MTPAADIWSVGCLVIELLTGTPPYFDCQPIQALYRIVQEDCPPLPDQISAYLENFLRGCFQKVCKLFSDFPAVAPKSHRLVDNNSVQHA